MKFKGKNVYLWGASLFLKDCFAKKKLNAYDFKGIIDTDETKQNTKFCGLNVYSPSQVLELNPEVIIISAINHSTLQQDADTFFRSNGMNVVVTEIQSLFDNTDINISLLPYLFKNNQHKLKYLIDKANNCKIYRSVIPSMLLCSEKAMLHLFAKYYYTGEGNIFDAGIFLGGCTEAFVNGLRENFWQKDKKKQIWAYELGSYDKKDYYSGCFEKMKCKYTPEENNFLNVTRAYLNQINVFEHVRFIEGDILKQDYPDKIEIMFLDASKINAVNFRMQQLFERLIPGKSVVIQQDYIFGYLPYIKITMGYLKDYFEFVGSTICNSAVFLFKNPPPPEILNIDPFTTFSKEELIKFHNHYNKYFNEQQLEMIKKSEMLIR